MVERHVANVNVVGSSPIARFFCIACQLLHSMSFSGQLQRFPQAFVSTPTRPLDAKNALRGATALSLPLPQFSLQFVGKPRPTIRSRHGLGCRFLPSGLFPFRLHICPLGPAPHQRVWPRDLLLLFLLLFSLLLPGSAVILGRRRILHWSYCGVEVCSKSVPLPAPSRRGAAA